MSSVNEQCRSQADLSACDREPIHIPGRIQPHGALLLLAATDLRVRHASTNCRELLGVNASDLLGQSLDSIFSHAGELLRSTSDAVPTDDVPALLLTSTLGTSTGGHEGPRFDVLAHRRNGGVVLELEPAPVEGRGGAKGETSQNLHATVLASALRVQAETSVQGLLDAAAREVRLLTGFDRVKVYRFDADWHGRVVAEDKVADWHSYLGHHFPASDIPQQARQLYALNRVRLIPDAGYRPVDILPPNDPQTGEPVDLTYAALRSVSPVHAEYLRNMGVAASMSISIVIEGRLWGLIACHHRAPKFLPYVIRSGCDHLGRVVAAQLAANERAREQDQRLSLKAVQMRLLERMAGHPDFLDGLLEGAPDLLALAGAGGVAVRFGDRLHLVGETPAREDVERIIGWIAGADRSDVYATEALAREFPPAVAWQDVASGILAARLRAAPGWRDCVVWFRPEVVRTVVWAGDPDKPVAPPGSGARIHPRRSFEEWAQVVRHRSRPWSQTHLDTAAEFRVAVTEVVLRKAGELTHERQRRAEAEAASRAKDRFLAALSHELRTPVSPVLLIATALADDPAVDPRVREDARTIRRNVEQQTRLIDDLLDVTRIENGKLSLHREAVDLHRLLAECADALRLEADTKGVRLTLGPPAGPRTLDADPVRIRQVFLNLLKNAVKFTPPQGSVTVRTAEGTGGTICVSVTDTGIGIDPDVLQKVFEPFEQGSRAITDEFSGLGLGLAITKGIVEAHGGTITATSEGKGRGATFIVELAARTAVTVSDPPQLTGGTPGDTSSLRILLVDDHQDTLRAMSRLLRRLKHSVTTADSVGAALAAASSNEPFDVLISDIGLPDGTGLDLMRELLKHRPIRGIALTGYGMESDVQQTRDAGYVAHLTKPVNFKELEAVLTGPGTR